MRIVCFVEVVRPVCPRNKICYRFFCKKNPVKFQSVCSVLLFLFMLRLVVIINIRKCWKEESSSIVLIVRMGRLRGIYLY